jgi:histone-lysine N-methyltransferase SETDB1
MMIEVNRGHNKRYVRISTDSRTDDEENDDDDEHENDDSCFILDAKHYGSISRFYNHSCKPNVHIQNVFINSHDPRFPVIALFACRNIRAGEGESLSFLSLRFFDFQSIELCWDYNYIVGCMPGVRIDCQCQSSNCRGRLL